MAPFLTGGTIIAVAYRDGVLIAGDTVLNYGSMRRTTNYRRIVSIGTHTLVGFTGDEADFKDCVSELEALHRDARCYCTPYPTTQDIHSYLSTRNFGARLDMDPVYNGYLVAGYEAGRKPFVGVVDMHGSSFTVDFYATGMGKHFALPVLRDGWRPDLTRAEALSLLQTSLRILAFNDANASSTYIVGEAKADGTHIGEPQTLELDWSTAAYVDQMVN